MKQVVTTEPKPIFLWTEDYQERALEQLRNLANHPFTFRGPAAMADLQPGYGMPIGGVWAAQGAISPVAVGSDIGCGVRACKIILSHDLTKAEIWDWVRRVKLRVPVGTASRNEPLVQGLQLPEATMFVEGLRVKAALQLGTVGSGNHFMELCTDGDNYWFLLHTGSRNLGKRVCDYYNEIAKRLNRRWRSQVPEKHDLAFLPTDTEEAAYYIKDMIFCLKYAKLNRRLIMREMQKALRELHPDIGFEQDIDCHHNFAALENHEGQNLWVHRKGAIRARFNDMCIIPGSYGTASYIGKGQGNLKSFQSCSHGAGRKRSTTESANILDLEAESTYLVKMGILHDDLEQHHMGEAVGAYKNIDEVMANQIDLVSADIKLTPITTIKARNKKKVYKKGKEV
jgi:tRNA-splicing ligase RtcB